jgi:tetratricopeptide (TPR) repeat protein
VVADEEVTAAYRIEAAFDLAGVLRGRGLFEGSLEPLNDAMPLIREEQLRLAMALSESGTAHLELGNLERAEALLDESIREAPGTATRYLFARGLFELRLGRFERLALTIAQTRELAGDDEDTASVEANAANYLAGLAAMEQGRFEDAEAMLRAAVDGSDYQYAIYRLGFAELLGQTGDLEPALLLARLAATERDPGDLRLDLELDRARALLLYAELLSDSGADDQARASARAFIDRWRDAGAERPEMVRAQRIVDAASGSQAAK